MSDEQALVRENAAPRRRIPEWVTTVGAAVIAAIIPLGFLYDQSVIAKEALAIQRKTFELQVAGLARQRDAAQVKAQLYGQQFENAPRVFTTGLAKLLRNAADQAKRGPNSPEFIQAAKALVSQRRDYLKDLSEMQSQLNHEMTQLDAELLKASPDFARVAELIAILDLKWPNKSFEVELAVRKILTDFGIIVLEPPPEPKQLPGAQDKGAAISKGLIKKETTLVHWRSRGQSLLPLAG